MPFKFLLPLGHGPLRRVLPKWGARGNAYGVPMGLSAPGWGLLVASCLESWRPRRACTGQLGVGPPLERSTKGQFGRPIKPDAPPVWSGTLQMGGVSGLLGPTWGFNKACRGAPGAMLGPPWAPPCFPGLVVGRKVA